MSGFITSALWNWFLGWPWYAHTAMAAGLVLFAWGALNGLYSLASKIGGWKAGLGALLAAGSLVAALWPRKRKQPAHVETEHVPKGLDALLPLGKPSHKPRKYDPDTNTWK